MNNYSGEEYIACKQWIADRIQEGYSWDQVAHFCTDSDNESDVFTSLQNEELIIPQTMNFDQWKEFVDNVRGNYTQITELYGIADKNSNNLGVPTDAGSA